MNSPNWTSRGKTIADLIKELQSFEDQTLEVRLSFDAGATSLPISLVGKLDGKYAVPQNCEDEPSVVQHG
jgi:hypothetical protein